jgi:hypothetical protein
MSFDDKKDALKKRGPHVKGRKVEETNDTMVLQSGGAIVEVPKSAIKKEEAVGDQIVLTLEEDAELLVGTMVSAKHGFLEDNVFGDIAPGLWGDNCNCNCPSGNCNCNCNVVLQPVGDLGAQPGVFRTPFTGVARGGGR